MDTYNISCSYDLIGYDDCGDDADTVDGGARGQATRGSLFVVGIWVSLSNSLCRSCR